MRLRYILLLPLLFTLSIPLSAEETAPSGADAERIQVGQEAPAFTLESSAGVSHSLKRLRGKKNLVVVFFRGTW
jgi:cytochrome oxidase Cu insertion factor (SCO1/SenC/PrrC family)